MAFTRSSFIRLGLSTLLFIACVPLETLATRDGSHEVERGLGQVTVRVAAANLSSGNLQSYDLGEGARILKGIHPDVVLIQELNYGAGAPSDFRSFVDSTFGTSYAYVRGAPAQIPNGIISRYPIIASGEWKDALVSNRDFVWARIDIPGPIDLWAISVHLLTTNASTRNSEAAALVSFINGAVPASDYLVLGGDFNTASRTEAALSTLSSRFVTAAPYPVDTQGDGDTNASRNKPYDWVVASPLLQGRKTPTVLGVSSFADGAVIDTRTYAPLSDLAPALAGDSAAASMQHMAVVRDFSVDSDTQAATVVHVLGPNGGESFAVGASTQIRWASSNVSSVDVQYAADGATYATVASDVTATLGALSWTVPPPATTAARVRVVSAADATVSDSSDAAFSVTAAAPGPGGVIVNEICANEPGSSVAGEFIEVVNVGGTAVDLSGWTLSDAVSTRHTFAAGSTLAPGAAQVVFGGVAAIPAGLANATAASTGTLALGNSGDTVTLKSSSGATVDTFTYPASLSGADGISMNRSPDWTSGAPFVLHTALSAASSSPGVRAP